MGFIPLITFSNDYRNKLIMFLLIIIISNAFTVQNHSTANKTFVLFGFETHLSCFYLNKKLDIKLLLGTSKSHQIY